MSTQLGKAYVQIVPTTKNIKSMIEKTMGAEVTSAGSRMGNSLGKNLVSSASKVLVVAAIGKVIKDSIYAGGELEQSLGGVETLFKEHANKVKENAKIAYKTSGLSANDYMQNVTSFSASLLQSLGGDTNKAAEIANIAMIDMADNANKMGTNMQDIQNAYQGFSKQNYAMLDNLKLGYGGTKKEMKRLLADAEKLTGVKYDIDNLSDVYQAIHAVQEEIGITGTTAKEADETLKGSFNSMKSSFSNLLGNIAIGNGTVKEDVNSLATTISTFLFNNLLPMLGIILMSLPTVIGEFLTVGLPLMMDAGSKLIGNIGQGLASGIPNALTSIFEFIQNMANYLAEQSPIFIEKGFDLLSGLVDGIINAIPVMIERLPQIIITFADIVNNNFPTIIKKGFELLVRLIKGIISAIPLLIQNLPKIIEAIWKTILAFNWLNLGSKIINLFGSGIKSMTNFVGQKGGEIFNSLWNSLKSLPLKLWNLGKSGFSSLGNVIKSMVGVTRNAAKQIFNAIFNVMTSLPSKMWDIGKNLVQGLWNGISNMKGWILDQISGFVDGIIGGIKDFFGIHSPSRVMENEVGKYLPSGLVVGIEKNLKPVSKAMDEMSAIATRDFEADLGFKANALDNINSKTRQLFVEGSQSNDIVLNANLVMGSNVYKLLVQDISKEQDRLLELKLAY